MEKNNFNRFSFSSLKYVKHVLPQVCEVFSEKVLTEKHEMEALFLKKYSKPVPSWHLRAQS